MSVRRFESWVIRVLPSASYVGRVFAVNALGAAALASFTFAVQSATLPASDGAANAGFWLLIVDPFAASVFLLVTAIGWLGATVMSLPLLEPRKVGATAAFVLAFCCAAVFAAASSLAAVHVARGIRGIRGVPGRAPAQPARPATAREAPRASRVLNQRAPAITLPFDASMRRPSLSSRAT